MSDFLIYEKEGAVVTLTMNEPEKRNPLSASATFSNVVATMDRIHDDPGVRCVILTGNGPSFSAGGDIRVMKQQATPEVSEIEIRHFYRRGIQKMARAIFDLEVPIIAAINGHAIGAGLDLACLCDIRIASETAKLASSFIKVGIVPGDGGAWLLPRAVGASKAAEMAFTGEAMSAEQALACGLVSRVVAPEQLLPEAMALARKIAANPGAVLRMTKRLLREGERSSLESLLELSAGYQAIAHMTTDHHEAVNAFIEKRPPKFSA